MSLHVPMEIVAFKRGHATWPAIKISPMAHWLVVLWSLVFLSHLESRLQGFRSLLSPYFAANFLPLGASMQYYQPRVLALERSRDTSVRRKYLDCIRYVSG